MYIEFTTIQEKKKVGRSIEFVYVLKILVGLFRDLNHGPIDSDASSLPTELYSTQKFKSRASSKPVLSV